MIGTSILTVYQGHISKASRKSSADVGRLLSSLDCSSLQAFRVQLSWVITSFLRSFLSSTKTKLATFVKTLIMF